MRIEQYLWIMGSVPFILLGSLHLYYTFFTNKFNSKSKALDAAMMDTYPILTRGTTMWKAWIGFNASHSVGCIYVGILNFGVAIGYPGLLSKVWYLLLNVVTSLFYLWLARKYWFNIPFVGVLLASFFFLVATLFILLRFLL